MLQSPHFRSGEDLATTLHRCVLLCHQQFPHSALGSKSPLQAMKDWHKLKFDLLKKQPYDLPGRENLVGKHPKIAMKKTTDTFIARNGRAAKLRYLLMQVWAAILQRIAFSYTPQDVYKAADESFQPGPFFEEIDPLIGNGKKPLAKIIAFYLPQYHEFAENNTNWGAGFTEWTNLSRNLPRFRGQIAPRVPRDLGFYDLTTGDIQRRQAEMARNAGIYGFCYYYYRFEGKPFMDAPLERMLKDKDVDLPFCLMWCNETWARGWVDQPRSVIAEQKYSEALAIDLVDDVARFMRDPRYIRFLGRPIFTVYRPSFMPNPAEQIARIRELFQQRHGIDALITLAETDAATDPRPYGMDGAVEFVANKFRTRQRRILRPSEFYYLDHDFRVYDYDELVQLSLSELAPDYPVARSVMTHWDKGPRRPGRGHVVHGSTPRKFEEWTSAIVARSQRNPFFGEPVVFVNAWNEWAESAYLEPDTHYGAAYLNSLARAVFGSS